MAGNIIPAIATTNAIVSGLIVLQAMHLLRNSYSSLRNVHLQYKPAVPLSTITLSPPNPNCGICRDTYTTVLCDPSRTLLGDIVRGVLGDDAREVSVYEDKRVLSDPDWDDNNGRTLESLNVTRGQFLTIVDEEGERGTIAVGLGVLPYVSRLLLPCARTTHMCVLIVQTIQQMHLHSSCPPPFRSRSKSRRHWHLHLPHPHRLACH